MQGYITSYHFILYNTRKFFLHKGRMKEFNEYIKDYNKVYDQSSFAYSDEEDSEGSVCIYWELMRALELLNRMHALSKSSLLNEYESYGFIST